MQKFVKKGFFNYVYFVWYFMGDIVGFLCQEKNMYLKKIGVSF